MSAKGFARCSIGLLGVVMIGYYRNWVLKMCCCGLFGRPRSVGYPCNCISHTCLGRTVKDLGAVSHVSCLGLGRKDRQGHINER